MVELSNAIRQRIINLSKKKKITLKQLSEKSMLNISTIDNFLLGINKTITLNTLALICYGLETNLSDFFNDKLFKDVYDERERKTNKK